MPTYYIDFFETGPSHDGALRVPHIHFLQLKPDPFIFSCLNLTYPRIDSSIYSWGLTAGQGDALQVGRNLYGFSFIFHKSSISSNHIIP
jgi:hypothetical protein